MFVKETTFSPQSMVLWCFGLRYSIDVYVLSDASKLRDISSLLSKFPEEYFNIPFSLETTDSIGCENDFIVRFGFPKSRYITNFENMN